MNHSSANTDPATTAPARYRGRFAPSPTGPLHFGSLVAAVASYLEAQRHQGEWLVRMEDVDTPRNVPGAADHIMRTLDTLGFRWDETVVYQSQRHAAYEDALDQLTELGMIYACSCSRKQVAAETGWRGGQLIYPGTCRLRHLPRNRGLSMRLLTAGARVRFADAIQGSVAQDIERDVGDFVLRRVDGVFTYQLAVIVDDAAQGITHVVRGSDLLDSTPRQIYLQDLLGMRQPQYSHVPVATDARGVKLSKQTGAIALSTKEPSRALWRALSFLGQEPEPELSRAHPDLLWSWARERWTPARIPPDRAHPAPSVDAGGSPG